MAHDWQVHLPLRLAASDEQPIICSTCGSDEMEPAKVPKITFSERCRALPQELLDIICEYVFDIDSDELEVTIDRDYKPPSRLQVNKASRLKFAQQYYAQSDFDYDDEGWKGRKFGIEHYWLGSLPDEHLALLSKRFCAGNQQKAARW